jgi:hypothetical protein
MPKVVENPLAQEDSPDSPSLQERFRSKLNEVTERLRDRVSSVVETTSDTLSSFRKSVEINFALATQGVHVEGGHSESQPELGSNFDTLFRPYNLLEIHNKFSRKPGGTDVYDFGEKRYRVQTSEKKLNDSPIKAYWDIVASGPRSPDRNLIDKKRTHFIESMERRGVTPEQLSRVVSQELPTRVSESFKEACDAQVQLERALISGASIEEVQGLVDLKNKHSRLAWAASIPEDALYEEGNASYQEGMAELISELEIKSRELAGNGTNQEAIGKINSKIGQLREKLKNPVGAGDFYHYENYRGSGKAYAKALLYKEGTTLNRNPFAEKEEDKDPYQIPSFEEFSEEEKLL